MSTSIVLLLVVGTAVLVGGVTFVAARASFRRNQRLDLDQAETRARRRLAEAESTAKEVLLEAKEEAVRIRTASEQEGREIRAQSQQFERRLHQKEENLERRVEDVERREQGIDFGGIEFPHTAEPSYIEFIYFAFTVGMTFQTSDTVITCTRIRLVVIGHGVAGFVFNIGVLAFTINVLGGH